MAGNIPDLQDQLLETFHLAELACFSAFVWDFAISLDFEWRVLSGKRKAGWPLLFYFLGRYLALIGHIGLYGCSVDLTIKSSNSFIGLPFQYD